MKKIQYAFLTGVLALSAFTSCTNEEDGPVLAGKGTMQLSVDILKATPKTRAVSEVTDFPVIVKDEAGNTVVSYNSVTEVPDKVTLSVGNYIVESHTPDELTKKMIAPYYKGASPMEILKGITSEVTVSCKMQNSLIKVVYDEEFRNVFTSWTITIDDGSGMVLSFDEQGEQNSVYYYFGENGVKELTVNFRGTTKDGSTIVSGNVLTKDDVDMGYDDDRTNFCGGDVITLGFTPAESTEGSITDITINADVTFAETNEDVNIDVIDKPGFPGGGDDNNPGGGDEQPGDDDTSITLDLPQDLSFSMTTMPDPSVGDTHIRAEKGLKSLQVRMESTNGEMVSSLGDLKTEFGVDFIAGAEVVGNNDLVSLFESLGQTLAVPAEGDKEYTFPIGNFFMFLTVLPGDHTFHLQVTDMDGNTKSGTLVITIE